MEHEHVFQVAEGDFGEKLIHSIDVTLKLNDINVQDF